MVRGWSWEHHKLFLLNKNSCWFFLLLVALIFSSCGKSPPRQTTFEGIEIRSQERLFHAAKREFLAARYPQAIQKLRRFSSIYPRSPYQSEVFWMLARSYHLLGDTEQALKQYQYVLNRGEAEAYHQAARKHMASLHMSISLPSVHKGEVFALHMTLGQWLQGQGRTTRFKNMARRGVTTQLINLGCGLTKKDAAFLFRASSEIGTPVSGLSDDFSLSVQHSHKQGMSVFIGVNLRCLGWLHTASNFRWADRAYDQKTQKLRSTRYFDIFNPEYQKFLKKMLVQLARTGVDGIVFLGEAPMGMFDGVTPIALAKFQQKFGQVFYPQKVFASRTKSGKSSATRHSQRDGVTLPKDSGFWRWVGWRARARLDVLHELMRTLKVTNSNIQVALEVSSEGLTDPLKALVQFTEDILESTRREFSFLLVEQDRKLMSPSSYVNGVARRESLPSLAKRFLEIIKNPTKIWMTVPRKMKAQTWSSDSLKDLTREENLPQGIGLVYDLRPFS